MGFTERKQGRHKGTKGRKRPGKGGAPSGAMNHLSHGTASARRMVKDVQLLGTRSAYLRTLMDHPSQWSAALKEWRQDLMASLGGAGALTLEAREVLSRVVVGKVILDSVDAYCLAHPAVNKQKKKLFPVILERDKLVTSQIMQLSWSTQ